MGNDIEHKVEKPEPSRAGEADSSRDADVIADEQEAMRRKAEQTNSSDEAVEVDRPEIAEIESIVSAFRH